MLADVFPDQSVLGGAPFNVARHLQAFGLHPLMISSIGNDAVGDALFNEMNHLNMDTAGIQFNMRYPTGQVKVTFENGGHSFEILADQAYDHINVAITSETVREAKPALAYLGTLAQRSMESRLAAEQFLKDCHCPVFLDINLRQPWYNEALIMAALATADIVKMNEDELTIVAAYLKYDHLNMRDQAQAIQKQFALKQLLITCGVEGSCLLTEQQQWLRVDAFDLGIPVVDTVGAGDAYAAVFLLGFLQQWESAVTLARASQFASAICTIRGAAPDVMAFYTPFLEAWDLQ